MKRFLLLLCGTFFLSVVFGQSDTNYNSVEEDLVGEVQRIDLQVGEFGTHFQQGYQDYQPCSNQLSELDHMLYDQDITIVLATWCHDSQIQVPRFYKILDLMNYDTKNIKLICVNHDKNAPGINLEPLKIERVPTFIFYKNGNETGRIIEFPENTLEADMVGFLK